MVVTPAQGDHVVAGQYHYEQHKLLMGVAPAQGEPVVHHLGEVELGTQPSEQQH